jgi:hypothetical protein
VKLALAVCRAIVKVNTLSSRYSYHWPVDSCLYDATDPPIVVDDGEPDVELDAAASDDDPWPKC